MQPITDTLRLEYGDFGADRLWQEEVRIAAAPNSTAALLRLPAERIPVGADRYLALRSAGDLYPANRYFFVPWKDLQRAAQAQEVAIAATGPQAGQVTIAARSYLCYVHLLGPDEHTHFSDNYFDLLPGERRTISITNVAALTADAIVVRWR